MNALTCHPDDGPAAPGSALRRRVRTGAAVIGTATVVLLAGCSSSSKAPVATTTSPISSSTVSTVPQTGSSSQPAAEPAVITIDKFAYRTPATVSPGATITVMNEDGENHTVTADKDGGFDVKVDADGNATFTAPSTPGTYPFHCIYHSNMHGTLVIK